MSNELEITYQIWVKGAGRKGWYLPETDACKNPSVQDLERTARFIKSGGLTKTAVRAFVNGKYSPSLSIEPV